MVERGGLEGESVAADDPHTNLRPPTLAFRRPNPEVAARKEPAFMSTAKIFIERSGPRVSASASVCTLPAITLKSLPVRATSRSCRAP